MHSKITAHMIVKNEDSFVWYAINSILPYVNKFFIFDTGSTDKTIEIIKSIKSKKIIFNKILIEKAADVTHLRQKQITMTDDGWIWIIDGDEIYPQKTVDSILKTIKQKDLEGIIVHRYDLLGDIYHYQDESVGAYDQFGKRGHYVLRLLNKDKISGLKVIGDYPNEYFADQNGYSVKRHGKDKFAFVEEKIFHAMYLTRSSKNEEVIINRKKVKVELGGNIPIKELPEIFFESHTKDVPDVTHRVSLGYLLLALIITPIKKIKRKLFTI